ncbi:hypothetical protein, partial [Filimonas effusa]|uniref:hypothetical protein n=1 Tax=Filimonas effusa TaxID=2508721 RepID=UPI0013E92118
DGGRVNKNTVPGYPADGYTSPNDWTQRLNGNGQRIGTGMVLKVMSGDKVSIRANSWYRLNGANPGSPVGLQVADLLGSLVGGIAGAGSGSHAAAQLQGNGNLSSGVGRFLAESGSN